METVTLLLFVLTLTGCVISNSSILYALLIGYVIFFTYGLLKKYSVSQVIRMSLSGVYTVKNILVIFILIGMLTALWRASGTIPVIISYSSALIQPSVFILMAFLLNCLVSVLTGTAFGTAATMGVVSMAISTSMNINPIFTGGAVLSGIFFGDRCSPVSTSALLVCELTKTDIFNNIREMLRTCLIPFLLTCLIYLVMGIAVFGNQKPAINVQSLFSEHFNLHWLALLPAAIILILAVMRIQVKLAMFASIATAVLICLFLQKMAPLQIFRVMVWGFSSSSQELSAMLDGGGIISMARVSAIICLSSSYAGIFKETGLLNHIKEQIATISRKTTPFSSIVLTSIATSMVSCNQSLAIMLTYQLCSGLEEEKQLAVDLENSAVVIAPLIPWSIAGAVPLAAISAPAACLFAACYLYLLPAWGLLKGAVSLK